MTTICTLTWPNGDVLKGTQHSENPGDFTAVEWEGALDRLALFWEAGRTNASSSGLRAVCEWAADETGGQFDYRFEGTPWADESDVLIADAA
jgi:hypothetical protein